MFKHLISLILASLLLCGCAKPAQSAETAPTTPEEISASTARPHSFYDAGSQTEQRTRGAVRVYPLKRSDCTGLQVQGESVLLFSGSETTVLTRIDANGCVSATAELNIFLSHDDSSLQIGADTLSFYDYSKGETVVLDQTLQELRRIPSPDDLMGTPILSEDQKTLYYCTPTALRAMDVETGICRCIREMGYLYQTVTKLHLDDSIISCSLSDETGSTMAYISAENGRLLQESADIALTTSGSRYYASFPTGMTQALLFGDREAAPTALIPADITAECLFLEQVNGAVTVTVLSETQIRFDYYDLSSGLRTAALTMDTKHVPIGLEATADGYVYILMHSSRYGCDTLYRWAVEDMPLNDSTVYTGPYFTEEAPDLAGLARCRELADEIGQRYGIRVLIWEEAAAAAPWDYSFEPEYLVPVIERELKFLDQQLGQFPKEMLEATASNFSGLTISLVRQLIGSADAGSLSTANGLQYFLGNEACIALAAGQDTQKALFHELYHVMETQILNHSIALDQWETLNPRGFSYDLDYRTNLARDGSAYLREDTQSFIDTYAMSYPKEDRARILEYACTPGNEHYFQSEPMQAKLRTLCDGIREAYGLENSTEAYLWEQYLYVPIT